MSMTIAQIKERDRAYYGRNRARRSAYALAYSRWTRGKITKSEFASLVGRLDPTTPQHAWSCPVCGERIHNGTDAFCPIHRAAGRQQIEMRTSCRLPSHAITFCAATNGHAYPQRRLNLARPGIKQQAYGRYALGEAV